MTERTFTPLEYLSLAHRFIVAIDGPAGSGKSSVSRAVALELGYGFLDTGACYRAIAWNVLQKEIAAENVDAIIGTLADFSFHITVDPKNFCVTAGETDITHAIREPRVVAVVSHIARIPEVRSWLHGRFRAIIGGTRFKGIVVEGRDITTVVAPDADVRILLTASEEARIGRRSAEQADQPADVAERLRSRDRLDSQVIDFMNAADGVITLDSTTLDFTQTVSAVIDVIKAHAVRN